MLLDLMALAAVISTRREVTKLRKSMTPSRPSSKPSPLVHLTRTFHACVASRTSRPVYRPSCNLPSGGECIARQRREAVRSLLGELDIFEDLTGTNR